MAKDTERTIRRLAPDLASGGPSAIVAGIAAAVEAFDDTGRLVRYEELADAVDAFDLARELHDANQLPDDRPGRPWSVYVKGTTGARVLMKDNGWSRVGF